MAADRRPRPTIVQPGGGTALDFGASGVASVMLGGEQTGGTLAVIRTPVAPGPGPAPHVHALEDELYLVAEGRISYLADGRWTEVGPGGVVYLPRGTPHAYRNDGAAPALHWLLTTPAGFERFFARLAAEPVGASGPDPERVVALMRDHGLTLADAAPG